MRITLPGVVNDFLHEMMAEYGFNKSALLESMAFYVSMPDNLEDFKSKYLLGEAGEDEDEDEDEDENEDEEGDEGPDILGGLLEFEGEEEEEE